MATHTDNGGGAYGRKFSISRENGQTDKNGRPYFFEWIKEIPENAGRRKFETRPGKTGDKHYELFSALDGYVLDIRVEGKDLGSGIEDWLIVQMIDMEDEYTLEIGRLDSRYSIDLLTRLLNPHFNPVQKLRLSPYSIQDGDRYNIGVSAYSGADKLEYSRESKFLEGRPEATSHEWKGKKEWDFSAVAEWLFDRVRGEVVPNLIKNPISAPAPQQPPVPTTRQSNVHPTAVPDDFPTEEPAFVTEGDNGDDLPF